ncbi:oligosaccharide flippase family protein [Patescibacteria group bacterium]|nr:oligosaccharide flippase family protein [Patescibacteria group bacterium]
MKSFLLNKYFEHKEIINNFFWRSLQIFGKQGVNFVIFLICAKLLNIYDFGVYNYILTVIFFLALFGDFGISTSVSKYVAEYSVSKKEKVNFVLFNVILIIAFFSVLVGVLIILFGKYFFGNNFIYIIYSLPLLLFFPLTSVLDGYYRGLNNFKKLSLVYLISSLFLVVVAFFITKKFGLLGAILSQNIYYIILSIVLFASIKKIKISLNREIIKEISRYAALSGIISVSYFLYSRFDILILEKFNLVKEIGYYEMINKVILLATLPFLILANVVAPIISNHFVKNNWTKIYTKFKKYFAYSFFASSLTAVIIFIFFPILLKEYLPNFYNNELLTLLNYLLIVFVFQKIADVIGNGFIFYTGHVKMNMILMLIFGVLNIFLSYYFISKYGFIGIGYSKIFSITIYSFTLIIVYVKLLQYKMNNAVNRSE